MFQDLRAKFRRQIVPGDQLRFEIDVLRMRSRIGKMVGRTFIDGKLVCEATLTCSIVNRGAETPAAEAAEPAAEPSAEPAQ